MFIQPSINNLNDLYFLDFLFVIGIKKEFITRFNNNISWNSNKNNLFNFRLFLKYYYSLNYNNIVINNFNNIDIEINNFILFGFYKKYANYYLNSIKNIYHYDLTINWIYRIIESFTSINDFYNICKFINNCNLDYYK